MSSFQMNKISGAVLLAGILAMVVSLLGDILVKSRKLEKSAYTIDGVEAPKETAAAAPAAEEIPPIGPLLASANAADGEALTKACQACHSFNKGGPTKVGPNLYGVVGGPHAHIEGFAYSAGIAAMHDKPWTYEELNHFLAGPAAYAPGTKMSYAGIKKVEQRANVIAYLRSLADNPVPLP